MWRALLERMVFWRKPAAPAGEPVDDRLADLFRQRGEGTALVGELIVLDLAEARQRVGEKWPLVSRHVHLLVENILSRRIRGNSLFFQCGEGVFAITFADKTREEAEAECQQIGEEIMDYLFGQALSGIAGSEAGENDVYLTVHSEVFEVEFKAFANADSPSEAIKSLIAERLAKRIAASDPARPVDAMLQDVERRLQELALTPRDDDPPKLVQQLETLVSRLRDLERTMRLARPVEAGMQPGKGLEGGWMPIERPPDPAARLSALIEQTLTQIAELKAEEAALDAGQEAVSGGAEESDVQWLSLAEHKIDFAVDYLPLLDITAGIKGIYLCRIKFKIGGLAYEPRQLMEIEQDKDVFVIADRLALRYLVQGQGDDEHEAVRSVFVVTLHQTTLENLVSRRVYIELASQLSAEQRRMAFFEIVLDEDWKASRLHAWLTQLRPYCRGLFLRFPGSLLPLPADLAALDLSPLRHRSGSAIGIDARDPVLADEEVRLQAMRRLGQTANEAGLRTYVLDVPDLRGITLCRAAAIRYLSCEAGMPATWRSGAIERMTVDDLIARMEALEQGRAAQR